MKPHQSVASARRTVSLIAPALVPSWRFFDEVRPSPRIEYALSKQRSVGPEEWREFSPRPRRLSAGALLLRLFWSPSWNESLFLVSCAERMIARPTRQSQREIFDRIRARLTERPSDAARHLRFRLVFISREKDALRKDVLYTSPAELYERRRK